MITEVIITDVTRMSNQRVCVACVTEAGATIRPILNGQELEEEWLYKDGQAIIRPFARVELDLQNKNPKLKPPHTEDWVIDPHFKHFIGLINDNERLKLLNRTLAPSVFQAFGTEVIHDRGFFVKLNQGDCSLRTIRPNSIDFVNHSQANGEFKYRVRFTDQNRDSYELTVTDLSFRYYVDDLRERSKLSFGKLGLDLQTKLGQPNTFLRLGLARAWHPDADHPKDRHHLQINGIYTFPDYLDGKCFADFRPSEPEDAFDEIPF